MPLIFSLSCVCFCAMLASAQPSTQPVSAVVLHHQRLAGGRELVVIREPLVAAAALGDLLPSGIVDRPLNAPTGFFSISVLLQVPNAPSLRLWSSTHPVHPRPAGFPPENEDYQILDAMVLPNRVILVMSFWAGGIAVHDIAIYGDTRSTYLSTMALAARLPTEKRLEAKLAYDEDHKSIEVWIIERSSDGKRVHTLFRQVRGSWEFDRVNQWLDE